MNKKNGNAVSVLRKIFAWLSGAAALISVLAPILSNVMQGYYKGLLGDSTTATVEAAASKQFWAQIGETPAFFCSFLFCIVIFLALTSIAKINKKHSPTNQVNGRI